MQLARLLTPFFIAAYAASALSFENVLGGDALTIRSSGSACDGYRRGDGCVSDNDSFRLYYGARFNEQLELRVAWSMLDIKLTDEVDAFFNSPDVSSELIDLSLLYRWHLSETWHVHGKIGLGYWTETLPGAGFFDSSGSNYGISPAFGGEVEWGSGLVRVAGGVDVYPSMGDAGSVSIANVGLRFVW